MEKYQVNDSELVSLYVQGNEKAFAKLVQRHKSKIYTTIYLIVKDQYVAEDLLQDTFEDGSSVFNTLEFSDDSVESYQIRQETHEHLRELIQRLPESQREVLVMRHYEDLSFQEIADATGVSINTALGRMRYALINLRKQLSKHVPEYDTTLYPK